MNVASLVGGMVAGADSIENMALRHGGMSRIFARAYAPSTLGSFLRAFTFGHVRQLECPVSYRAWRPALTWYPSLEKKRARLDVERQRQALGRKATRPDSRGQVVHASSITSAIRRRGPDPGG